MGVSRQALLDLYTKLNTIEEVPISERPVDEEIALLSLIIETKIHQPEFQTIYRSLYIDIKHFITIYVVHGQNKEYGYDKLSTDVIDRLVMAAPLSNERKYVLLDFLEQHVNRLTCNITWIKKNKNRLRLQIAKKRSFIKYILLLSSKSVCGIVITLFLLFCVECIFLIPTPIPAFQFFSFNSLPLSNSSFINHVSNVLCLHLGIVDGPTVDLIRPWGVFLMFIWQLIWIILVVNILFRNLLTHLDINESES